MLSSITKTHIPTSPKLPPLSLPEKLPIAASPPDPRHHQDAQPKRTKQRTDGIKLAGKNLEHHQGERKLRQRRANVGAFKRALRRPYLDELGLGQLDGPRAAAVGCAALWGEGWLAGDTEQGQVVAYEEVGGHWRESKMG